MADQKSTQKIGLKILAARIYINKKRIKNKQN